MNQSRGQFAHRHQYEAPLMQARMGHLELWRIDEFLVEKQQIQVDFPGFVAGVRERFGYSLALASHRTFDRQQ